MEDPLAFLTPSVDSVPLHYVSSTSSLDSLTASTSSLDPTTSLDPPSPRPRGRPEWYRISDETVEPSSLSEALRANPFMLFYERVGGGAKGRGSRGVTPRVVERWAMGEKGKEVGEEGEDGGEEREEVPPG